MSINFLSGTKHNEQVKHTGSVTVKQGELIPFDGEVIEGLAMVDESAIVGVSTPALIDETAGRNQVLKDTLVVEGSIMIRPTSK